MKPCKCLPPVENPTHIAWLTTGGICIYNHGASIDDAIERVKKHAKKDRIPRSAWVEIYVTDLAGVLVQEEGK